MTKPRALDILDTAELIDALLEPQFRVPAAVTAARPAMRLALDALVRRLVAGGRIVLVGAGTSGRLALMEAEEIPGTFGVAPNSVLGLLAGRAEGRSVGDAAEDDEQLGAADVRAVAVSAADCMIALAASGSTPYTVSAACAASAAGATVISVTTSAGSPLARIADVAIEVLVGPEALGGSTRMASGTAQKVVLNVLTTAAMVRVGHVHDQHMIDVVAANEKLRRRAIGIVADVARVGVAEADRALRECGGTRAAIVHLLLGVAPAEAERRAATYAFLRDALSG